MKSRALLFWLAVLMVFGGAMTIMYASGLLGSSSSLEFGSSATVSQDSQDDPEVATPDLKISEFQMVDQLGRPFHSDQLEGHVWVGSIFFSKCPSTCRMQNAEVARLQAAYGDKGVRFVSITCDPDNDTVAALAEYSRMFNADPEKWFFLTGSYEEAERIGSKMFGITVQRETHSDRLVLVDREGNVHSTHRSMKFEDVAKAKKEIELLLAKDQTTVHMPEDNVPEDNVTEGTVTEVGSADSKTEAGESAKVSPNAGSVTQNNALPEN